MPAMYKYSIRFLILLLFLNYQCGAQLTFPVNGIPTPEDQHYLIKGAHIQMDSSRIIPNGMMLLRQDKIVAIGKEIEYPEDAIVIDAGGKYIYPAFIEMLCSYGIPENKKPNQGNEKISERSGAYSWNEALKCDQNASTQIHYNEEQANTYRKAGFAIVQSHVEDGISRGSACIMSLDQKNENELLLKSNSAHVLSFSKGTSTQSYPGSLMGSIALLRQTFLDGHSYASAIKTRERNLTLESWISLQALPQIFATNNLLDELRAIQLYKEWNLKSVLLKASGKEYQKIKECKIPGVSYILPINFPAPFDLSDPYELQDIELADLKHWEMAPSNPAQLYLNKVPFALTMDGLKSEKDFLTNLRKAVHYGLPESYALHALTSMPAQLLKLDSIAGRLENGKWASFIITNGRLFEDQTQILETWIMGKPFKHQNFADSSKLLGLYQFKIDTQIFRFNISIKSGSYQVNLTDQDSSKNKINANLNEYGMSGKLHRASASGTILFSAIQEGSNFKGQAYMENGEWQTLVFEKIDTREMDNTERPPKAQPPADIKFGETLFPFCAYGWSSQPVPKTYLIKNATVWTNEKEGILQNADVLVQNGKIIDIGKLNNKNAILIDGTGKHLTPGIIDEHSHIAVNGGVNECSHSITSEVRIGDVINSEDINIYRQLAGGVTSSHLLHGSCNPIGGQTALIKMRWGLPPEQLKFEDADGFIKFALGENVKRSGGNSGARYPDTRMGVEQIYLDAFQRAKEYELAQKLRPNETRRNLQLEALVEVLNKKRFITCHSYVQSEINMMMKVAERYGFTLNTFTHILEGYKVADIMKKHGAGAAGFADWWAYKFEVYEAIPYNGALMHQQGVVNAFNSDDAEMARRLNQEAAKAVMYGNVSEEEALKFVTLNPAKLLHIDHRVGSIKKGKDADLVLWNDHPLSIKASADMTFVDGIKYFDRMENTQLQQSVKNEKNRIVQKMIKAKESGEKTENYRPKRRRLYHCDSEHTEID